MARERDQSLVKCSLPFIGGPAQVQPQVQVPGWLPVVSEHTPTSSWLWQAFAPASSVRSQGLDSAGIRKQAAGNPTYRLLLVPGANPSAAAEIGTSSNQKV